MQSVWCMLILVEMLSRPRTPQPDNLASVEEDEWDRHQQDSDVSQQGRSPLVVQLLIRLSGKQWEASFNHISHQDNASQRRGRVCLVAVDDVIKDTQNDDVLSPTKSLPNMAVLPKDCSYLLELPSQIRLIIYQHLFARGWVYNHWNLNVGWSEIFIPHVLLTCHKLRPEALLILIAATKTLVV